MATSQAMSTNNQYIKYSIECITNATSVVNNVSSVTVKVRFWRTNTGYSTSGSGTVTCKINGVAYTESVTSLQKITENGIVLFTKTLNIPHNADGTKSLTISAYISHSVFSSSEQSWTTTLATIPRTSTFLLSSTEIEAGGNTSITIARASTSFTHKVYFIVGTRTYTVGTSVSTSIGYTIPLECIDQITNNTSGTGVIKVETYNGTTKIGEKSTNITINIPKDIAPTFESLIIERIDSGSEGTWGAYVQSKSKAKLTIVGAKGVYGSTITRYTISGGGYSGTSSTLLTGTLETAGTNVFTATVKDSRGRTTTKTISCEVLPYATPKILTYSAIRCLKNGTESDEGTYVKIFAEFDHAEVSMNNTVSGMVAYRTIGSTIWSNNTQVSNGVSTIIGNGAISSNTGYEIKLTLTDTFTSVSQVVTVATALTTLDFREGGRGIAIGKVCESDGLEVDWNSTFNGSVVIRNKAANSSAKFWSESGKAIIQSEGAATLNLGQNNSSDMVFKESAIAVNKPMEVFNNEIGKSSILMKDEGIWKSIDIVRNGRTVKLGNGANLQGNSGTLENYNGTTATSRYEFNDNNFSISPRTTDKAMTLDIYDGTTRVCSFGRTSNANKVITLAADGGALYFKNSVAGIYFDTNSCFRGDTTNKVSLGNTSYRFNTIYYTNLNAASDLRLKENVRYVKEDDVTTFSLREPVMTTKDFYDFVKDDLHLAIYDYKVSKDIDETEKTRSNNKIGFIAQDIVETKVGSKLINSDVINKDNEELITTYGLGEDDTILSYDLTDYVNVLAGALKTAIQQIETLTQEVETLKGNYKTN